MAVTVKVNYQHELNAAAADAWVLLGDFGSLLRWVAGGNDDASIALTGEGVGMLRDLQLPSVGSVQHRLDALDNVDYKITYTLTRGKPLGMAEYSVTAKLVPGDAAHSSLLWEGEFVADAGASEADMAAGLRGAYADMSTRLNELLT